ncbi:MAG: RNA-binding protein [Nitrospinota bacterium]|nr:RNA-binding protein [Nitrospinota bacterium]MDH5679733.1 RNA-binding protein [Nitrospinota bacterium]MDH5757327.1 RNA-binding protein [Nitrospinota bacterium]
MNIYVGNLPFSVTEDALREMFEQYGEIQSAKLITDRETGRTRGFGFVEMDDAGADAAIKSLNNTEMEGRKLKVNQSEPRKSSSPRQRW